MKAEPPRVPVTEVLMQHPSVRKYILDGRESDLHAVIKDLRGEGMQTFTDSLVSFVENQYIHPKVALANAPNPEELKMRLKGITTR